MSETALHVTHMTGYVPAPVDPPALTVWNMQSDTTPDVEQSTSVAAPAETENSK